MPNPTSPTTRFKLIAYPATRYPTQWAANDIPVFQASESALTRAAGQLPAFALFMYERPCDGPFPNPRGQLFRSMLMQHNPALLPVDVGNSFEAPAGAAPASAGAERTKMLAYLLSHQPGKHVVVAMPGPWADGVFNAMGLRRPPMQPLEVRAGSFEHGAGRLRLDLAGSGQGRMTKAATDPLRSAIQAVCS